MGAFKRQTASSSKYLIKSFINILAVKGRDTYTGSILLFKHKLVYVPKVQCKLLMLLPISVFEVLNVLFCIFDGEQLNQMYICYNLNMDIFLITYNSKLLHEEYYEDITN